MVNKTYNLQIIIAFIFLSIAFYACEEETSIGRDILPSGDLIEVRSTIIKDDISAFTFNEKRIQTNSGSVSLLGSFTDSLFGNTTVDLAAQFRLYEFPDFGTNAKVDSVKLYMYYATIYGDTLTAQKFKVYELTDPLYADTTGASGGSQAYKYYQDIDLKGMSSGQVIGEIEYIPRPLLTRLDSSTGRLDTLYHLVNLPIDNSLGEKLMNADSLTMVNNEKFLKYFKGLLIESEKINHQGGAILSVEAAATSGFQGSALALFYSNDDVKSKAGGDTSLLMPYVISKYSARVNRIVHDYTETPFFANLNLELNTDSLVYVQSTGGLKSRVLIEGLTSWADSTNTAINKAELIFQIDTVASDIHRFPPPTQLLFTVVDTTGVERLPIDYVFSPIVYGGYLRKDYTYHFNITQHLQQIIEGKAQNGGFYLTPAVKSSEANRVVIKGSNSKTGIKLVITYSKFKI